MSRRALAAALVFTGGLCLAGPATATEGEHEWHLSLGGATAARSARTVDADAPFALAVDGGGWLHVSDFWAFGASVHDRRSPVALKDGATSVTADARFTVDALQWIPSVAASVGPALTTDGVSLQARLALSVAWRSGRERAWTVGFAAEQDDVRHTAPRYVVTLGLAWFGGRGIGLDL